MADALCSIFLRCNASKALTGLWKGPAGDDYYVMTHDLASGNLTVWWDSSQTPVGGWWNGHGTYNADTQFVQMHFNTFDLNGMLVIAIVIVTRTLFICICICICICSWLACGADEYCAAR